MTIKTVVFDFGNVLGFFSHAKSCEQLARLARAPVNPGTIFDTIYGNDLEERFEVGKIPTREVLAVIRGKFDLQGHDDDIGTAYADMFTPNPDTCSLVPQLKTRYRLILLSNTNDLHYRHFRQQFASVLDHFDHLVLSHEVGARKPHREIYERCQHLADCPPESLLFIDDLQANVDAARARGWGGIVYHPAIDLRQLLRDTGLRLSA